MDTGKLKYVFKFDVTKYLGENVEKDVNSVNKHLKIEVIRGDKL